MKCINCGAELNKGVCEYCGTDYNRNNRINGSVDKYEGTITIGGKEFHVYLAEIQQYEDNSVPMRLEDGRLDCKRFCTHRRFVFEEW